MSVPDRILDQSTLFQTYWYASNAIASSDLPPLRFRCSRRSRCDRRRCSSFCSAWVSACESSCAHSSPPCCICAHARKTAWSCSSSVSHKGRVGLVCSEAKVRKSVERARISAVVEMSSRATVLVTLCRLLIRDRLRSAASNAGVDGRGHETARSDRPWVGGWRVVSIVIDDDEEEEELCV